MGTWSRWGSRTGIRRPRCRRGFLARTPITQPSAGGRTKPSSTALKRLPAERGTMPREPHTKEETMSKANCLLWLALWVGLVGGPATISVLPQEPPKETKAQPAGWTPAEMMRVKSVGDVRVSPDGRRAVFTVTQPVMAGEKSEMLTRSEERRVGKECRSRGSADA